MTKVMLNFQYQKGTIKLEFIPFFWYEFVKLLLYFVENAAALNEITFKMFNGDVLHDICI